MKKNKIIFRICFALLALIFILPWIQYSTGFMQERKLHGHFYESKIPVWSIEKWFSGSLQDSVENYTQSHLPLKPSFIRLRNQMDYSFFGKLHVKDVHVGKNEEFFRYTHYFGDGGNYPGDDIIHQNVTRLKKIQEQLKSEGKFLVFVFAADKLWYLKEKLPDPEKIINPKSTRCYDAYKKQMMLQDCEFIDFNSAFLEMKDTIHALMFGKGGFHWSEYAGFIAMDSIVNYILSKKTYTLNTVKSLKMIINHDPWYLDRDIYDACNLQFNLKNESEFYHPKPVFLKKNKAVNAIISGDSFCRSLTLTNYFWQYFGKESSFWYYNREIYNSENKILGKVDDKITSGLIKKSDIYIVLFSPSNLENFEYGFLEHFSK